MKGVSSKTKISQPEASVSQCNNNDLTALLTFLITEIKNSLATKIDLLCTKLDKQQDEIEKLYSENINLREIITSHEKTILKLKEKSAQSKVNDQVSVQPHASQPTSTEKQRGIKAFNLIFTCQKTADEDPKSHIENILFTKYSKKPYIQSVNVIDTRELTAQEKERRNAQSENSTTTTQYCRILVTFNSIWDARSIYRDRIKMLKNSDIYVSEDLTKNESKLFYMARSLKKRKHINNTWTEEGATYIKLTPESIPKLLLHDDPLLSKLEEKKEENEVKKKQENESLPTQEPMTSTSDPTLNVRQKQAEMFERITRKKTNNLKIQ